MFRVYLINNLIRPALAHKWLWIAYLALYAYGFFVSGFPISYHWIFLCCVLALFTVPHAIGDLYAIPWILNPPWEKKISYWFSITLIYWFCAFCFLGIWKLAPNLGIATMAAFIVWHWGSLDTIRLFPIRGIAWVTASVGRGILVIIAPLYFRPLETYEIIFNLGNFQSSAMLDTLSNYSGTLLITALSLTLFSLFICKFIEGNHIPKLVYPHILEAIVILAFFKYTPTLIALTFYFLALHSVRQINRLPPYIPERRGMFQEFTSGIRNFISYYDRIRKLLFVALLLSGLFFAYHMVGQGLELSQVTVLWFKPMCLFLFPHMLAGTLVDFNPRSS